MAIYEFVNILSYLLKNYFIFSKINYNLLDNNNNVLHNYDYLLSIMYIVRDPLNVLKC